MGDFASVLRWHYTDPLDEFERRSNHAICSSSLNPSFFTNNRDAYVDMPYFAWSVFGGGNNDSTLFVGGAAAGDGRSSVLGDFGTVIVGGAISPSQAVLLEKSVPIPPAPSKHSRSSAISSRLSMPSMWNVAFRDFGRSFIWSASQSDYVRVLRPTLDQPFL